MYCGIRYFSLSPGITPIAKPSGIVVPSRAACCVGWVVEDMIANDKEQEQLAIRSNSAKNSHGDTCLLGT